MSNMYTDGARDPIYLHVTCTLCIGRIYKTLRTHTHIYLIYIEGDFSVNMYQCSVYKRLSVRASARISYTGEDQQEIRKKRNEKK